MWYPATDGAGVDARVDRRVVLVGEIDDGEERVGAKEVVPLLEERGVDAGERGDVVRGGDRLERIGLDEEAVPALELRLDAASGLADAA